MKIINYEKLTCKEIIQKSFNNGIGHENPTDIFKKINYELLRAMNIVADKIKENKIDDVRQKNFNKL